MENEKAQLLADLLAERDSLEQRVIWLTDKIRSLQEEVYAERTVSRRHGS